MIQKDKIVDSLLVLECQRGNTKATSLLVKRWHKKLCRHSYWYTKDLEMSKDIVQDCWSVIINKINNLKDPNSFGSWVLSIVTRKTIDCLRKQKREIKNQEQYFDAHITTVNPDKQDSTENVLGVIKSCLETLPEQQRMILHLFYLEEFSIKQISDTLSLPIGTIKSRIFYAREKLKSTIKIKYHEE